MRQEKFRGDDDRKPGISPKALVYGVLAAAPLWILIGIIVYAVAGCASAARSGASVRPAVAGTGTPFNPARAVDGVITVRGCPGGLVEAHWVDLQRAEAGGHRIALSGDILSACTLALAFDNVSWADGTRFCFHAATVGRRIDRAETRRLWDRYPPAVRDILWSPDDIGHGYRCLAGDTITTAMAAGAAR